MQVKVAAELCDFNAWPGAEFLYRLLKMISLIVVV